MLNSTSSLSSPSSIRLKLQRDLGTEKSTPGRLFFGDNFFGYTLERPLREEKPRAIPSGTYKIIADHSEHFGRVLPHILDVPDFEGIRIHGGNHSTDSEGCVLLGAFRDNADQIHGCADLVQQLVFILQRNPDGGTIEILSHSSGS